MTLPRCRSYLLATSQSYVVATYMHLSLFRLPRQNFGHQITLQLQNIRNFVSWEHAYNGVPYRAHNFHFTGETGHLTGQL